MDALLLHLQRSLIFGRHVRPRQIARRFGLEMRRRAEVRFGAKAHQPTGEVELLDIIPLPLFSPRGEMIEADNAAWRFTFLHHTRTFPRAIPWLLPDDGPRDQLWKMNLHYMEYLEDVDDTAFVELIESWIKHNRPFAPGFWRDAWNSYAVSIRVVVWLQQLSRRRDRLSADCRHRLLTSVIEQLIFLEKHLETDLGGNHLMKNIKALLWASCCFTGRHADRWRRRALALLESELDEQILPDGMHVERSPSYHCQVFADLLECRHALGQDPLGGRLDDALHRMAKATADLTHPDGLIALFNDSGLNMAYAPAECLQAYERLFERPVPPDRHIALDEAGYFGMRESSTYCLVDCGPIGPDHLPAHGHGDILSFELSVAGQRVIVDPGVFEYNPGALRDEARSTRAHNTVSIDHAEQCDFFSSFRCGRRTRGHVLNYEATADGMILEGTHGGFDHLPGSPKHKRRFDVRNSSILIEDWIENGQGRDTVAGFLLHPACRVEVQEQTAMISFDGGQVVLRTDGLLDIEERQWFPDMGVSFDTSAILCRFGKVPQCRTELTF